MEMGQEFSADNRASFWARGFAIIIDGLLMGLLTQIIQYIILSIFPLQTGNAGSAIGFFLILIINLIVLPFLYYVPLMKRRGQTIGKILMQVKVINADNTEGLKASTIILREFFGKFVSSFVFLLGYIVYLFGKETWHDKIASTRVISIK